MSEDRRRPGQYASERDAALESWMPGVVHPYSRALRPALDRIGGRRAVTSTADLAKLPVAPLAELGDGRRFLLEPSADEVAQHGPVGDRVRLGLADLLGRRRALARREVEPAYKPIVWTTFDAPGASQSGGTVFVASTTTDLDRLAALGRRGLSISGIRASDRVLVLDPAGSGIAPWQFLAGARDAGVAVLHLDRDADADVVRKAAPTVLAGGAASLVTALAGGLPESVRLLIVHDGHPASPDQAAAIAGAGVPLAEWWVPPGARAAWVRCPGGAGFHTWPTAEVVEVVDGRLVWTPVGWHGTVWLRVDTGVDASIETDPCGACGRTTPRVVPSVAPRALADAPPRRRRRLVGAKRTR